MQLCSLRVKSVSLLSAQPTEILGTKLKLPRQRALGLELGWNMAGLTSREWSIAFNPEGAFYSLSLGQQVDVRHSDLPSNQSLAVSCAPNPTSGAATLNITTTTDATTATVWAYNAYGSRLMRREIPLMGHTTEFQIPEVANWPAGLYVWKVKVGDVKKEGRLLKQ